MRDTLAFVNKIVCNEHLGIHKSLIMKIYQNIVHLQEQCFLNIVIKS